MLCYNGELYNYREIRAELARRGLVRDQLRYRSRSRGMATVGSRGACDDFGACSRLRCSTKRPVLSSSLGTSSGSSHCITFVARTASCSPPSSRHWSSAFGAELRMLPQALVASMLYYWVPDQMCSVQRCREAPTGHLGRVPTGRHHRVERYWDIVEEAAAAQEAHYDLGEVIEDSVNAHLVADVPVSSFLSGGLDSSIVTVLAKRANPQIDAYTITFRAQDQRLEAMPDDAIFARKVARRHGIELHEIEITPDVVDLLPRMVDILDEPTGDPAAINTLLMSEGARAAGVKVLLSGMGADELFGGYRKHVACLLAGRYRKLPAIVHRSANGVVERLPVTARGRGLRYARWAKRFTTFAELPEEAAFRRSYSLYAPDELATLLGPELQHDVDEVIDQHLQVYEDNHLPDRVNRMCLADTRMFLPGLNLAYTDRASMAASTEVRVPFVDPMVFRAAFSLAWEGEDLRTEWKSRLEAGRPVLAAERDRVSTQGLLLGSTPSVGDTDLREVIDDSLLEGDLVSTGFLNRPAVAALVEDHRSGREDRSKQIWQLLTLEFWYRQTRQAGVGL